MRRRTALITGGTGDIGSAIVQTLLKDGYDIIIQYYEEGSARSALNKLEASKKKHVSFLRADFSSFEGIDQFLRDLRVQNAQKGFDAVVFCAGHNEKKAFTTVTESDYRRVFGVNTFAPLRIAQALIQWRALRKEASVILLGTPNTFTGGRIDNVLYTSGKASLHGLTRNLAKELAPRARINCVVPGYINTSMLRKGVTRGELHKKKSAVLMRRFGESKDVANLVQFLLSGESTYITGQTIHINGGLYFS